MSEAIIVDIQPLKFEWKGELRAIKVEYVVYKSGFSYLRFSHPETEEFLGEWDRDMGGGLYMFGADLENEEVEYIQLEDLLYFKLFDLYPGFFSDTVNDIMWKAK